MSIIKSYTDLEQSKKLVKILPLESADMKILSFGIDIKRRVVPIDDIAVLNREDEIPCWSLAALLDVIPCGQVNRMVNSDKWEASSWNDSDFEPAYYVEDYGNPIDACVAMIEKLNELKIL